MLIMEKRTSALQNVSEALHLDSKGFHQDAFAKYLESLQALSSYLKDLYGTYEFTKVLERRKEVKHVLSVIHECSDRMTSILDKDVVQEQQLGSSTSTERLENFTTPQIPHSHNAPVDANFPAFEKMKSENMYLFKTYQQRIERARDKYTKSNLRLELQRRMAENLALAKAKYELALKEHQKENFNNMEQTMKKLFENGKCLSEQDMEKKDLYSKVLHYSANETWPCALKSSSLDLLTYDVVQNVFQRTIQCSKHPLSHWLIQTQSKIKQDIYSLSIQYLNLMQYLPDQGNSLENKKVSSYQLMSCTNTDVVLVSNEETVNIPLEKLSSLQRHLQSISSEIKNVVENAYQVFYLTYNSLLPIDSESICYKFMESFFLQPLWPGLIPLFRLINLTSEYKILENMLENKSSSPTEYGFCISDEIQFREVFRDVVMKIRRLLCSSSLTDKLENLIHVSQKLCNGNHLKASDSKRRHIGADDFIPLLCYVIVQSESFQLVSECYALEQLFDQKYMFGEEGYALSSFLTALKYLEMKKLIDEESSAAN